MNNVFNSRPPPKNEVTNVLRENSNMTNEECYRQNGALSGDRMTALFEAEDRIEAAQRAAGHVREAQGCFEGEDMLSGPLDDLRVLKRHVRGDNLTRVNALIERLEGLETEVVQRAEYGRSEISLALNILEAL